MVTGANGFIASWIVKQLLEKKYTVHACVRDASIPEKVNHLLHLPNADKHLKLFSTGDLGSQKGCFDEPMSKCDAVFHAATPLSSGSNDGEKDIFQPAMASTEEILECISRHKDTVKCLVLTSSMAAVAPRPEPEIKDESHWSNPEEQKARGGWYGATKTCQEKRVQQWVEDEKAKGAIASDFKYVAICPTMVLGPVLNTSAKIPTGTMGRLVNWLVEGMPDAPNDSMSFIHVEDCARMHTNVLELKDASGRYMCLVESWHWNDILALMKELYPKMPDFKPYVGSDKVVPTRFNLERMRSLGVTVRSIREILQDSLSHLQAAGVFD